MRMKRFLGNALNLYMMVPFHLRNMMCSRTKKNSFAVWRHLRNVNRAVEEERQSFYSRNDHGDLLVYHVCGWGVASDCTRIVQLDEQDT